MGYGPYGAFAADGRSLATPKLVINCNAIAGIDWDLRPLTVTAQYSRSDDCNGGEDETR